MGITHGTMYLLERFQKEIYMHYTLIPTVFYGLVEAMVCTVLIER